MDFFNDETILLLETYLLWGFGLFITISLFCILYYFKGKFVGIVRIAVK